MVEEERLNRVKFSPRTFPLLSVKFCLERAGINLSEVDHVAIGLYGPLKCSLPNLINGQPFLFSIAATAYLLIQNTYNILKIPFSIFRKVPSFHDHHTCHAYSVYFCSNLQESMIISWDGSGGNNAGFLGYIKGNDLTVYHEISNSNSWGNMYSTVTGLLGFNPHSDEYKVMGLASFGMPDEQPLHFIKLSSVGLPYIDRSSYKSYLSYLKKNIDRSNPMSQFSKNVAATLQASIEFVGMSYLLWLKNKTNSKNLCISGGVSLNCTLNGKLKRSGLIENLMTNPAAWDSGTALGAALKRHIELTDNRPEVGFDSPYWGPEFSNSQILNVLKINNVNNYRISNDVCKEVAELINRGQIVGWFQGRTEIGPRSLGNRSILGNPSIDEMKDLINIKVKGREPWRPFAPSIMEEYLDEYLECGSDSPYMQMTFSAKELMKANISSALHVDGTCRPHTVSKKTNPLFWKLIDEFRKISGVPVLLNTSFNLSDEPIVNSPEDAIKTFYRCGLDFLIMNNIIIKKKDNDYRGEPILNQKFIG